MNELMKEMRKRKTKKECLAEKTRMGSLFWGMLVCSSSVRPVDLADSVKKKKKQMKRQSSQAASVTHRSSSQSKRGEERDASPQRGMSGSTDLHLRLHVMLASAREHDVPGQQ